MWGENWGEMIWGSASSASAVQVPLGPWSLILLGFMLGLCAVYASRNRKARMFTLTIVLLVPLVSTIAATLPHTFSNGTPANADQVNANFEALLTSVNTLEQRVEMMESVLSVGDGDIVKLKGSVITIDASTSLKIDSANTLDISGINQTNIKGGILRLNNGSVPNARVLDPVQVTCVAPALGAAFVCTGNILPPGNPSSLN